MTSASPGPHLFSILSKETDVLFRPRKDTFLLSLLGQTVTMALILYFTSCVIRDSPGVVQRIPDPERLQVVFAGRNGGGGGNHDPLPASNGGLPRASLAMQIVPPTVIVLKEIRKLTWKPR